MTSDILSKNNIKAEMFSYAKPFNLKCIYMYVNIKTKTKKLSSLNCLPGVNYDPISAHLSLTPQISNESCVINGFKYGNTYTVWKKTIG